MTNVKKTHLVQAMHTLMLMERLEKEELETLDRNLEAVEITKNEDNVRDLHGAIILLKAVTNR